MDLFWAALGWGDKKVTHLSNVTYNDETWHSYTLPKKIQNYINHLTYTFGSADISIFSPEISNFRYIKKYRYRLHFNA